MGEEDLSHGFKYFCPKAVCSQHAQQLVLCCKHTVKHVFIFYLKAKTKLTVTFCGADTDVLNSPTLF